MKVNQPLIAKIHRAARFILGFILIAGAVLAIQPSSIGRASSNVILVNSALDRLGNDNLCTLREAVISANKNSPSGSKPNECPAGVANSADVIRLPNNLGVYLLTRTDNGKEDSSATGDLDILADLVIEAQGSGVIIQGTSGFTDRIFHILAGTVSIKGITLAGGNVPGDGGGIYNKGNLTLLSSTLASHRASRNGGGIYNDTTGTLFIENSTLSGSIAPESGGGIYNNGSLRLNNTTITNNTAGANTGGMGNGGGIAANSGTITLSNTIIAGNFDRSPAAAHPDCSGALQSLGYNLVQSISGCTLTGDQTGNQIGVDPLLGSLQDNGGGALTHAPAAGSPAIDGGSPDAFGGAGACATTDQRGTYRPHGKACDIGSLEAGQTNSSLLIRIFPAGTNTMVVGRLASAPNTSFAVQLYAGTNFNTVCGSTAGGAMVGGPIPVSTGPDGNIIFRATLNTSVPTGQYVTAITTDPAGFPSQPSRCVRAGAGNDSWPHALPLSLLSAGTRGAADETLDLPGQSRWYKFQVQPNSKVIVTLTGLPADYDLTLYKDIGQAFKTLATTEDLLRLTAEFSPDAFTPDAFTADVFSPDAFTPDAFTPDAFTPDAFTPDAFTPDAFTPDAFTPDAFTPDAFTPDAFTPDAFTPDAFTPDAFTPDAFTPDAFTPEAFSSAQTRSLIAISAFDGLVSEGILANTWDSTGSFYVRVRGRNGAFDPSATFHLEVRQISGNCGSVSANILPPSSYTSPSGNFKTAILTNLGRMEGTSQEKTTLQASLASFAARSEVAGVVVDVMQDARVVAAFNQSDQNPACPLAANLAAGSIKNIVDTIWQANPSLAYIVLVGNDTAIPFFRHPDQSMLASEKNYIPPVRDGTSSQASLRLGYVLSQDDYGARLNISYKDNSFPIPYLAVGRLVETAADATTMLAAYLGSAGGVVPTPNSVLVTGYDFLEDASQQILDQLSQGVGSGSSIDTLISPRDLAPTDPAAWTAADLRSQLLGKRHDLIFLAGHFSANSALAADYTTRLFSAELAASPVDLTNTILFSAGCHAGYNIVNPHGVPLATREPDWAQVFARKGATLIAGTGYQYGDTDFVKYSEQLYLLFSEQLRTGNGPVAVGQALVAAKQAYLAQTPYLRGIDEKTVLEATLFGLPMLSVDLPGSRQNPTPEPSLIPSTSAYATDPGAFLGLRYADLTLNPALALKTVQLTNVQDTAMDVTATYLSGPDGEITKPNEPVLPLEIANVSVPGTILRGVGFRSGAYTDLAGIFPLTGATTTEIRGVHAPFLSDGFYPSRIWNVNYFNPLSGGLGAATELHLIPAQYQPDAPSSITGILRRFDRVGLRLFYSSHISTYGGGSTPAMSAAPAIVTVSSSPGSQEIVFRVRVAGNPAAGVQEVWVTYTGSSGSLAGQWQSLDLLQSPADSTLWEGRLPLSGASAGDIRYIVQAVNGVGLVSMDTNQGRYYIPGAEAGPTQPTTISFEPLPGQTIVPASGKYSTPVSFRARLQSNGAPLAGQVVLFRLGPQSRIATTDAQGVATVTLSIFSLPGTDEARASFAGAGDYQASYAVTPFQVLKQDTQISLDPQPGAYAQDETVLIATLVDADNRRLGEETLFFLIQGNGQFYAETAITDYIGRARLGRLPLPPGTYTVDAYYSGNIPALGLSLDDERYQPATATGTLVLQNHLPSASPDVYQVDEDTPLAVPAPGVLGNDSDADGDPLTAALAGGPAHGSLALNPDGSFTYTPFANYHGSDSFTYIASDGRDFTSPATVTINVASINDPPDCSLAGTSEISLWPPNGNYVMIDLTQITDPDGDPVTVTITAVFQDEPVGSVADAVLYGSRVALAARRDGSGDGRVYHIFFTVVDGQGGSCSGELRLGVVPHDQGGNLNTIDGGALYDSTKPK